MRQQGLGEEWLCYLVPRCRNRYPGRYLLFTQISCYINATAVLLLCLYEHTIASLLPLHNTAMTPRRRYPLQPFTKLFLAALGLTGVVWVLRGLSVLSFLPGVVLWVCILLCFGLGIVSSLQRMR